MAPPLASLAPPRPEEALRGGERARSGGVDGDHPDNGSAGARATEPPPTRASGVELLGRVAGSGYRRPPSLVRRADGQTIQVTPIAYEVLEAIDGRRHYEEIASEVSERISRHAAADDVRYLTEEKLRPLGLLRQADGSEPIVRRRDPLLALRMRKVITNPNLTGRITAPFAKLFVPPIVIPVLLAFAATSAWLILDKGLAAPMHEALYEPGRLLLVFALMILSAGFHEFGHAAAATYGGIRPGAMGMGVYLVWPVFYTDVTEAYRLERRGRLRVDMGGLYFNAIFAVATVGVWALTGWDSLLLLVPIQIAHMLHQLLPLVRFDGYHILADLTGVPDLFAHIKPTLLHLLPTRWGKKERGVLRPLPGLIVTLWVLTVVPVLGLVFATMVMLFPRLAATAWDSVGARWELLQADWASGNAADVAVLLLSIATIALPVLGVAYLVVRVVRRTGRRVWRGTAGRPVLRTLAVLATLAGVAFLAFAWWPNGQYRPIQADERVTTARAVPHTLPAETSLTVAPPEDVPPAASPQLAFILTPAGEPTGDPIIVGIPQPDTSPPAPGVTEGWVFPFDPPAPPGEGDNQALAINTQDGSTVYDVSIGVVWVTGDEVDNVNEAWAMASCSNCTTVAVAYQVLFALDEPAVVTPQNVAVAANYECRNCQTFALAGQLVVTLTDYPSPEAMSQLARLSAELETLEANIQEMPLDEIYAELGRIEGEIVQVLVQDGALELSEGVIVEVSSSVTPAPSPEAEQVEPAPIESAPPITSESPAPTASESPAPAATESSPPTATEESPSPSSTESPAPTESSSPAPSSEP